MMSMQCAQRARIVPCVLVRERSVKNSLLQLSELDLHSRFSLLHLLHCLNSLWTTEEEGREKIKVGRELCRLEYLLSVSLQCGNLPLEKGLCLFSFTHCLLCSTEQHRLTPHTQQGQHTHTPSSVRRLEHLLLAVSRAPACSSCSLPKE